MTKLNLNIPEAATKLQFSLPNKYKYKGLLVQCETNRNIRFQYIRALNREGRYNKTEN